MRAAFRVDASAEIGSGHSTRCAVLAEALRRKGVDSLFLCRADPGHPGEWLTGQGFAVRLLPPDAISPIDDAAACAKFLAPAVDFLIVDHYGLGFRWESALRGQTRMIMAIDDLANRPHDCDLLVDANWLPQMETRYDGQVPPDCSLLLGPAYTLLHPSFGALADRVPEREKVRRLLLFFGGGDADNLTVRALRELDSLHLPGDVVIGAANPHRAEVEALCRQTPERWTLHIQTPKMAECMAQADLAIGAGGSSHWERCLMGLPAVVVAAAPNQIETSEMLAASGACRYLGESHSLKSGTLLHAVEMLIEDPEALRAMSRAARSILPDGHGADRVATQLMEHRT